MISKMISGSDSHPTLVLIIPARLLIFISHFSKGVPVKLWFEFFWTIIVCMIAHCITQDCNPLFPWPLPSPRPQAALLVGAVGANCGANWCFACHGTPGQCNPNAVCRDTNMSQVLYECKWTEAG